MIASEGHTTLLPSLLPSFLPHLPGSRLPKRHQMYQPHRSRRFANTNVFPQVLFPMLDRRDWRLERVRARVLDERSLA